MFLYKIFSLNDFNRWLTFGNRNCNENVFTNIKEKIMKPLIDWSIKLVFFMKYTEFIWKLINIHLLILITFIGQGDKVIFKLKMDNYFAITFINKQILFLACKKHSNI